jgi:large subunit ribosomal protein L13
LASKQEKVVQVNSRPIVVDGSDLIAGRLCSNVSKLLLKGNHVSIVNCEKIMISGKRRSIIEEYKNFLKIASIIHPKHGPFHPRRPDTIISRMVRGMLPRDKPSGQAALKRLRAYVGVPKEIKSLEKIQFENSKIRRSNAYYLSMADLGRTIGWTE